MLATRVLRVQIAPLVFSKSAVFCFEEINRDLVASVEVECSAIAPGDSVTDTKKSQRHIAESWETA